MANTALGIKHFMTAAVHHNNSVSYFRQASKQQTGSAGYVQLMKSAKDCSKQAQKFFKLAGKHGVTECHGLKVPVDFI